MRKAELGETITIEGKTVKLGGRVAFLTATLLDKNQKIIATGKHTKLILGKMLPISQYTDNKISNALWCYFENICKINDT